MKEQKIRRIRPAFITSCLHLGGSTTLTVGVGTRKAIPVSFPCTSGQTRPTALAAPVEDGMNAFLIETVLDDVGKDLLDRNQQVVAEPAADFVLGGKTFKDRIDPQKVLDAVFDGDPDFFGFHWEERRRLCRPAIRNTWATSGCTFSSPKSPPLALAALEASMQRWIKADAA